MRIEFNQIWPGNIIQCDTYPPGKGTVVTYDQVNEKYKQEDFLGKEVVVAKKFDKIKLQAYGGTCRYPLHYARSVEFNKEWAAKLFKGKFIDGKYGTKIWEHEDGPYVKLDKQEQLFCVFCSCFTIYHFIKYRKSIIVPPLTSSYLVTTRIHEYTQYSKWPQGCSCQAH